jgi:hypothetical protein
MGIRQCGKTFIAQQFASENYKHVVYINFFKEEERKTAFYGSKDVDNIIMLLSAQMRNAKFVPGETCIILDEIQECPEARTSLKFFKEDGRYDIIATGSLLGVLGYGQEQKKRRQRGAAKQEKGSTSIPVGYEEIVEMYPLDFEEFLWANNMSEEVIDVLRRCLAEETPVPLGIHVAMKTLLYRYVAVGGLPAAVNALLETNNMNEVDKVWHSILKEYRSDMVKYAEERTNHTSAPVSMPYPSSWPRTTKNTSGRKWRRAVAESTTKTRCNGWKMPTSSAGATTPTSQDCRWKTMRWTTSSRSIRPI